MTLPFRLFFGTVCVLLFSNVAGFFTPARAQGNTKLAISRLNQSVVTSWLGENEVVYQLQSSPDLSAWSDLGPSIIGNGSVVNFPSPISGQLRGFFRLSFPGIQSAIFDPGTGVLKVIGDNLDNNIVVGRDSAGNLLINGGTFAISGGTATVANTTLIQIYGRNGADQLTLDESSGALPKAELYGEGGNDILTGGSGADLLNGGPGNDLLFGKGGTDTLLGGDDNDTLIGGPGDDQVFGEAGNDRLIWNPGDGTDLDEGGNDSDTVEVNGADLAEVFTTTANGSRVRFDRVSPTPFTLDIATCEFLVLNANGGNDQFSATGNLAALIKITVDGGAGDDALLGSNGADILIGGDDNDFIDGNQGNDTVFGGNGNDTFQWDPGDGSDIVEGQGGIDRLVFNGANLTENTAVSANGSRVRFTRDVAAVTMDLDDVETLELNALGGADNFTINDLSGTDLTSIRANLGSTIGGNSGDGAADTVIINGTAGDDIITATLSGDLVVTGLAATVTVHAFESASDMVRIQSQGGDDIVDASAVGVGGPFLIIDGGSGNDILLGSASGDNLIGGDNDDVLLGNGGVDVLDGGAGDNTVIQDGTNITTGIISIFGDGLDNTITISRDAAGNIFSNGVAIPGATVANTSLIRVFGQAGNDIITLNEANGALPAAMLFGGSGNDTLTSGSGADLLFGGSNNDTLLGKGGGDFLFGGAGNDILTGGSGDDQIFGEGDTDRMVWNAGDGTDLNEGGLGADTVEVNGGNVAEQFTTTANGTRVRFDELSPAPSSIDIGSTENLVVNANGGNDIFSATGNLAALISITVDGGAGDDTLSGSNGADVLIGGDNNDFIDGNQGNDVILLGEGDDTFQWDPGDGSDIVEGQGGHDVVVFNGSAANEIYTFSANGARLLFNRNIGAITLDANGIEQFDLRALAGVDNITVNSLAATNLTQINLELAGTIGGSTGDSQADAIIVNGTAAADTINLVANAGVVEVNGLATQLRILHSEVANDSLTVNGLGGIDTFNVGLGVTGLIQVTTNQ